MPQMNEIKTTPIESLLEKTKSYSDTSIELFKLKTIDKVANIFSSLIVFFLILVVVIFFLLMLNVALAQLLGEWLGKNYYGFLSMAILDTILIGVVYAARRTLIKEPILHLLIRLSLK
jgi:hypothetical protein